MKFVIQLKKSLVSARQARKPNFQSMWSALCLEAVYDFISLQNGVSHVSLNTRVPNNSYSAISVDGYVINN